jgi:hypothetical protein
MRMVDMPAIFVSQRRKGEAVRSRSVGGQRGRELDAFRAGVKWERVLRLGPTTLLPPTYHLFLLFFPVSFLS